MSSDRRRPSLALRRGALVALAAAAAIHVGCGYKKPPIPPPRKIPQRATIAVHQRGSEAIVTFPYPSLTISGTALSGVSKVEVWRLRQEVPAFAFDLLEAEAQSRAEAEALLEEHGIAFGVPAVPAEGEIVDSPFAGPATPETDEPAEPADEASPPPETGPEEDSGDADGTEGELEEGSEDSEAADDSEELSEEEELQLRIEAAQALLRTPGTPMENYISATETDFRDDAELILESEGDALTGAVVGDQIVLRTSLPLPFQPPIEVRSGMDAIDGEPGDVAAEAAAAEEVEAEVVAGEDTETAAAGGEEETPRDPVYGYLFSVKIYPTEGNPSDLSPLVGLFPIEPPAAPTGVAVTAEAGGVLIDWEAEEDPEGGFRIYRREAQARLYGAPVATLPGAIRTYTDRSAIYGARYIYGVAAVGRTKPLLESELSSEHEVDYQDRFGPGTPTGLVAFPEVGRVRLLWDASDVPDLAGYRVLRRSEGGEAAVATEELVTRSQYLDEGVSSGQLWYYSIVAVDQIGNASEASAEISVQVP